MRTRRAGGEIHIGAGHARARGHVAVRLIDEGLREAGDRGVGGRGEPVHLVVDVGPAVGRGQPGNAACLVELVIFGGMGSSRLTVVIGWPTL